MKITLRTAQTGSGSFGTTLGDDGARDFIVGFRVRVSPMLQVDGLFHAAAPKVFGRGNRQVSIDFVVSKEHATIAAGALFMLTAAASVPALADLKIEQGATVIYAARAGLVACEPVDDTNKSTAIHYTFVAETVSASQP